MIQQMVAILSLVPLPFLNPAWTSASSWFQVLLKPSLKDFEHNLASMWNECNCMVVWIFLFIALLWQWNEKLTFSSPVTTAEFSNLLIYWVHSLTTPSFRIRNSSTGILSYSLALFVVILPKAHLTSLSKMTDSWWVITPSWLSGSWRSFCIVLMCILVTSS